MLVVKCDLGHLCTYKLEKDDGFHVKYIGYGPLTTLVANGACKYEESICLGVGGTPIQRSAQLWIRRRALTAQQLSLAGAPSGRQRASGQPRPGRPRPGPTVTQNSVPDAAQPHWPHANRIPAASNAKVSGAPAAPHVALPVPPSLPEPPARRVLRPGRDPDADTAPRQGGLAPHG